MVIILRTISRLLRIAYHLLYYQLAFSYDLVAWMVSGGEWADWRRSVFPFLTPGPVLEVAHGTGTLALELAARGHAVTAFDLSPAMGRIARGKLRAALHRSIPGVRRENPFLLRANIFRLPLAGETFACAASTFPAEFILDPSALREVNRVLRPGGRWIIVPSAYPVWLDRILQRSKQIPSPSAWERAMQSRMAACGFKLRTEYIRRPRSVVVVWVANKQPAAD
jgi:ubiquinone/menaquinone biosynthesis C-methylase UbiE